ncbi:aquaporin-10 isoform X1 [Cygnus olor]|uniref:aquaporin-10 isoform X1 n=1 Tax=Cygnus olor TaxID=8869 RepID=UPI001ADE1422|nr:aquaporin-10 isoform X1 [Cygnus olor]
MGSASFLKRAQALLHVRNRLLRECLAELLAVFVLILITLSGSAQMVTSSGTKGNILTSYLAGALAVMVAVYTAGGVSGAHLNPAFSLCMCLLGQLPLWKFPIFVAVQTLGSFIAAGAVYALYYGMQKPMCTPALWGQGVHGAGVLPGSWLRMCPAPARVHWLCPADAIQFYSNGTLAASGPLETASIFATYPAKYLSLSNGFLDQVMGTALLIVGILAITDTRNKGVPKGLEPVAVALLVFSIEVSMGSNCGCPMNPARDFGPRLFTYVAGWGAEVFSRDNAWWWVPVVAPLLGAAVGTALYQLLVAFHHPAEDGGGGGARGAKRDSSSTAIPLGAGPWDK